MALINTELLLQPVSSSSIPTGENLEYMPEFAALERAAEGKPERQMGSAIVPGEPPNFPKVLQLGVEMLGRSKDLRIASKVVRALLETGGYAGIAEGLRLIRGLLEQFWEQLYPELDPDDGDATMRMAALSALGAPDFVAVLRAAPLIKSPRFGPISLRDIAIASGELQQAPVNAELDTSVIVGSFREADLGVLQALLATLQAARGDLGTLRELLESRGAGTSPPDFSALDRVLYQAGTFVRPHTERGGDEQPLENGAADAAGPASVHGGNGASGAGRAHVSVPGAIRGRDDVVLLLDRICEYYAKNEPSSPLPMLLQRCRRLVSLSFLDIMKDMAPEALPHLQIIAGKSEESSNAEE
jgi:type VI secretion system protein ImpA